MRYNKSNSEGNELMDREKKILLVGVNARYSHTNPAIRYLRNYCGDDRVYIKEFTINNDMDKVLEELLAEEAGVYAFSVYIWNVSYIYELAAGIRRKTSSIILMGGPEVTYDYMTALNYCDYCIIGEGEKAFREFSETYFNGGDFRKVHSLCFLEGSDVIFTEPSENIDLNEVSQPYRDLGSLKGRLIYYESSRGCPFSCAYCLSSEDKKLRFCSLEKVFSDLKTYIDAEVMKVKFVDRTFNADKKRAARIIDFVAREGKDTEFHFEIAADLIDEDFINAVNSTKKGKLFLEIGLQSTHKPTLEAINRVQDFEHTKKVVREILHGHRASVHLDLIAGLPLESYKDFQKSFDDCMSIGAPVVQLGFLKVLKGSPMEKMTKTYGIEFGIKAPYEVISTSHITKEELDDLRETEYLLERLYNSGLYYYFVHEAAKEEGGYYKFFGRINTILKEKKLEPKFLSEQDFAHILYEYALEKGSTVLKDTFLLDWYLRKHRAYIPRDIEKSEEWKRAFYMNMPEELLEKMPGNKRPWHYSRIEKFSFDVPKLINEMELSKGEHIYFFNYNTLSGEPEITGLLKTDNGYTAL